MKYIILPIEDLNEVEWSEIPYHSPESVRTSLNGSKFIIKYKEKPSFINEAIEYSHDEILNIVSGSEWTEDLEA